MSSLPANQKANKLIAWLLIVVALGTGVALRFAGLEERPMHVDEAATGAQILADYLESGTYQFNPHHYHGPLLPMVAAKWCQLNGQRSWLDLNEKTLRQVTAACGALTLAGVFLLNFGLWRTVAGIAFLATSPLLVYYSRMYIHEPVFILCAVPALTGMLMILRGQRKWIAAGLLGIGIGLMAGTRETVVISVLAWGLAGIATLMRDRGACLKVQGDLRSPFFFAVFTAVLVTVFCYALGGQGFGGFVDFLRTYFEYEPTSGHEKSFLYYVHTLIWPKLSAGRWWTEAGILLLGALVYLGKRSDRDYLASRFLFEAGLLHLLIYSLFAYKTPWLANLAWMQLCLSAAFGLAALCERLKGKLIIVPIVLFLILLGWQGIQAHRAAFRLSSDGRNPYAYVPTATDVVTVPTFLFELQAHIPKDTRRPLAIIGESYWPLPWYLRDSGQIGYFTGLPESAEEFPILLLMPSVFDSGSELLEATHTFIPRGLRDEFPMIIAVNNTIWSRYQDTP